MFFAKSITCKTCGKTMTSGVSSVMDGHRFVIVGHGLVTVNDKKEGLGITEAMEWLMPFVKAIEDQGFPVLIHDIDMAFRSECAHLIGGIMDIEADVFLVLGSKAFEELQLPGLTLTKARKQMLYLREGVPILSTYHPQMHLMHAVSKGVEGKELFGEYCRIFDMVNKLLHKTFEPDKEIDVNVVRTEADKMKVLTYLAGARKVTLDIETNQSAVKDAPELCILQKPDVKVLCFSVSKDAHSAWVVPHAFISAKFLQEATRDKILGGCNFKYDLTGLELKYQTQLPYAAIEDVMLMSSTRDLSCVRNGLKDQCEDKFFMEDWSKPLWAELDELKKVAHNGNKRRKILVVAQKIGNFLAQDLEYCQTNLLPGELEAFKEMLPSLTSELIKGDVFYIQGNITKGIHNFEFTEKKSGGRTCVIYGEEYPIPTFEHVNQDALYFYCAQDTMNTMKLWQWHEDHPELPGAYQLSVDAIRPLLYMEAQGIPIHKPTLMSTLARYEENIARNYAEMERLFPEYTEAKLSGRTPGEKEGKATSANFLRILRLVTGMPELHYTENGDVQVDKFVIQYYEDWHPIWKYIKRIRKDSAIVSGIKGKIIPYAVDYGNNLAKLHSVYKVATSATTGFASAGANTTEEGGTVTGRLSAKPNPQNLPKEQTSMLYFQALKDFVFFKPDFPAIEMRVYTDFADIKALKKCFKENGDPHIDLASDSFEKPKELVTHDERDIGKRGNFGTAYEISEKEFAHKNKVSPEVTHRIFLALEKTRPEIKQFRAKIREAIREGQYITTPYDRRRMFVLTGDEYIDAGIFRQAGNFPIQSTASDLTLSKYIAIYDWIAENHLEHLVVPINIVHDSIWFMVHKDYFREAASIITAIMGDRSTLPWKMSVPIDITKFEVGTNLGSMHEFNTVEEAAVWIETGECAADSYFWQEG